MANFLPWLALAALMIVAVRLSVRAVLWLLTSPALAAAYVSAYPVDVTDALDRTWRGFALLVVAVVVVAAICAWSSQYVPAGCGWLLLPPPASIALAAWRAAYDHYRIRTGAGLASYIASPSEWWPLSGVPVAEGPGVLWRVWRRLRPVAPAPAGTLLITYQPTLKMEGLSNGR